MPVSYFFYTLEDTKSLFGIECARFTIAFICLILFVPLYNIYGAAISVSTAFVLTTIIGALLLRKKMKGKVPAA